MGSLVKEYISTCLPCTSASAHNPPVPLQPILLPDRPWQKLHADFKGPIGGQYYFHIVIDQYSKYPEVDIIKSTSFNKLRPILDRIIASHGVPESITTDNGPPYNSHEMQKYAEEMGFKITPVSPEDPQCNGFAENFVKTICKLLHTSVADRLDPRVELHKFLLLYRATPHTTTELSHAEMLYNRKIQTKLPQYFKHLDSPEQAIVRTKHDIKKQHQKEHYDSRHKTRNKDISVGDKVLIQQSKSTVKPPFNPLPLTVISVKGNRTTACWPDGTERVRDKNKFKKVHNRPEKVKASWEKEKHNSRTDYSKLEIEGDLNRIGSINRTQNANNNTASIPLSSTIANRTRSRSVQLQWNRTMNSKLTVIPE